MDLPGLATAPGEGVIEDEREAARWFHPAATPGRAEARCGLAFFCAKSRGVRCDLVQASVEFTLAAAAGDPQAPDGVRRSRPRLDQHQVHRAEARLAGRGV